MAALLLGYRTVDLLSQRTLASQDVEDDHRPDCQIPGRREYRIGLQFVGSDIVSEPTLHSTQPHFHSTDLRQALT